MLGAALCTNSKVERQTLLSGPLFLKRRFLKHIFMFSDVYSFKIKKIYKIIERTKYLHFIASFKHSSTLNFQLNLRIVCS